MEIVAAVSAGAETPLTVRTLTLRAPRPDEVLVRVLACGICHTDLTARAAVPATMPIVLGHEGAGVVEAVGGDVAGVAVGDRVLLTYQSCGNCPECARGLPGYCAQWAVRNAGRFGADSPLTGESGPVVGAFFGQSGFASHVLATPRNLVVVDPDLDPVRIAAFGCSVQTGAGVVAEVLAPDESSVLAIFGVGAVGMSALLAARALGVGTVVAVDLSPGRLALAAELGADLVLDGGACDVAARIAALPGGGATHALDTTGAAPVLATALDSLTARGVLALVGLGSSPVPVDVAGLIGRGKTLRGSIEGDVDPRVFLPRLTEWYRRGLLPMDKLVRAYPVDRINDAVADTAAGTVIKAVVTFP
ncbi:NAD(P)-dependent alcohol dehydrogenase [Nocardia asteroides]|uniref:NAD(P)-dependent alcohol dehydrogenase n=1 Tax=Nocardia asteroides TaxID=1824 RepID=UPI001E427C1E|nr:NAD(P)-dependent alcohol dehydrogenase [Nocardia asteroides]UGT55324.1 NAD(P)-dependent alcohol dehydrogenase [Nocardia asteroides]